MKRLIVAEKITLARVVDGAGLQAITVTACRRDHDGSVILDVKVRVPATLIDAQITIDNDRGES